MDIFIIPLAALLASTLTLFSGFGLGTLLMPVVAVFFPVEVAIGMTALVHFANNLFKLALLGRQADVGVIARFGIPAVAAALLGAVLLGWLATQAPLLEYPFAGGLAQVTPVKLMIGTLILVFVLLEFLPAFKQLRFGQELLPLGGLVSGFFGGLSGHQGAFRSMFLLKSGLDKEAFIATGVVLAVLVDMTRLVVYGWESSSMTAKNIDWVLVGITTLAAFTGAFVGKRLMKKMTIHSIQMAVSALLVVVALGLMAGVL
ncbi:sulfite exporter TauE/SafE family protein [Thiothrix winogradskyi]|uniref:Probable membrane transporter protein n=1 Tax=Thiothrix winogradskyi TaxID=96472 RepID=A0ABY3T3B0_9GAMM|nr:sulfite exporter TauE/SafE family protein [Thiothrix winogradskyi]UJS26338.1 sulfite exporter TauE/SafE family protein [Thiothrix winogradskyi]